MDLGLLLMGSHPPERSKLDAHRWDLDVIKLGDELGYVEAWIGEHFAALWEPLPTADYIIAQALTCTRNIKLGAGVYLLPFHHPVDLAHRISYLDHLAHGRLLAGIGSGGLPVDVRLFNVDYDAGEHREMFRESLEIMLLLWKNEGPADYKGKFWTVRIPGADEFDYAKLQINCAPFTKPHPPIAVAAGSPRSQTLRMAGERGYIPLTLGLGEAYLASQWDTMREGRRPGRYNAAAPQRLASGPGHLDRRHRREGDARGPGGHDVPGLERVPLPLLVLGPQPIVPSMKHDDSVPDDAVTLEYIMENAWLVGSPDTVAKKLRRLYEMSGGFGVLLAMVLDHTDDTAGWEKTMRLLVEEVMPQVADLKVE